MMMNAENVGAFYAETHIRCCLYLSHFHTFRWCLIQPFQRNKATVHASLEAIQTIAQLFIVIFRCIYSHGVPSVSLQWFNRCV